MIPISLTLQGIYSYQERQTIDFTRLTEASIFGIFGSVGSGKSTILEAMTFALYGKTDRLNLSGDNRNYNMMNLKSNELFIELIFKTGKNDSKYMALVKGRRNSRNFDDVRTLDRTAYKRVGNEWQPIETDSLENVIGLSYENFKRTVIIPQGRFQEFLQLGNSDRTKMMKELFGLEKYELFYKVVSLETKTNQQIQNLEGQLQQIGEINPEQIKATEEALELAIKKIGEKSAELTRQQQQEEKLRKLRELAVKITELEQTVARLKAQEPDFALLEKSLREYEFCLLNFKNLLDSAKEATIKIAGFEQNIAADEELLKSTEQQLSTLEKNFETLQKEYEDREQLRQKADELDKIAKINGLSQACDTLNNRISEGESVYKETLIKVEQLKESQESTSIFVRGIRDKMPNIVILSEAKDWFTVQTALVFTKKEIAIELDGVERDLQEMVEQKAQLLNMKCLADLPKTTTFSEMEAELEQKKEQFRLFIKDLDSKAQHLSVQSKLEEYANNLEDGKPCPLCGALSHPQPLNAQSVSEELATIRTQKSNAEVDVNTLEKIQKQLSEVITTTRLKQDQREKVLQKQKEHGAKTTAHKMLFHWEEYKEEKTVSDAFAQAEKLQLELKTKESELDTISRNLLQENQNKEKFNKAIEEFRHQLTANTTETATLTAQIRILRLQDYINKTVAEIGREKEAFLQKYREIENTYQSANKRLLELQKNRDILTGRMEANKKTLEQELLSKKTADTKLQLQLNQSGYSVLSEVEQILSQLIQLDQEKKRVSDFRQSLELSGKQLMALQSELGGQKYNDEEYKQVTASLRQLSEDINLSNQQRGKLEDELKNTKVKLETQKELQEHANALRLRAEEIKTLKQLFKGSGFVNYISSVYLQELCYSANERFYKLTKQRLSLEVTDDNNFQVRDFINGGKVRNVKTLSGGQTFQAALSLALALADNIQKITESSQNFFFLDEGFGSLDKESLDIVFDTLKSLRKEKRIVGVISHVEEMQQEIDTHLKIVNDEEKGSLILINSL